MRPLVLVVLAVAVTVADAPYPYLRREPSEDARCAAGGHFYTWDSRFTPTRDRIDELYKRRCVAIGPHRAMNITNWCCP